MWFCSLAGFASYLVRFCTAGIQFPTALVSRCVLPSFARWLFVLSLDILRSLVNGVIRLHTKLSGVIFVSVCSLPGVRCDIFWLFVHEQIFVGGLDQEVNDADFRAYFTK